jgi:hypothetical protein
MSSKTSSSTAFIVNETTEQVNKYIDEICADPSFLCSNKDLCGSNSTMYANTVAVNKICTDIKDAQKCDTQFSECMINTINTFDEDKNNITTSFVNIILPITGAFDENANQKFLRLPALSGSKKPKSQDICNICACMNRFSTSPGSGAVINESSYTAPGQNTCIYPEFIEHYYYPMSVQQINTKLQKAPPVKIGKYTVLNENIIFAHTEEDLLVTNLYDLLIKNGILPEITKKFILNVLYKNDEAKSKQLNIYIANKQNENKVYIKNGIFYKNITFFYVTFVVLLFLLMIYII